MKHAIPEMLKAGGGSIINTASTAGERGVYNHPAYSASKGGIIALSRVTAVEYANQNIRVNCIVPGNVITPMSCTFSLEVREKFLAGVPRGSFAEPGEIAQVALFLASDESCHIIGHALAADGGVLARLPG